MSERSNDNGGGQETTAAVWAGVAGTTVGDAWLRRDEPKSPEVLTRYRDALAQLERGVPFAYAVGSAGFRTLDLKIDRRALIPRPETEGLVELILARCSTGLAADIGTGCGCIALSLAVEGRFERIVAVEQSPAAAALARENLQRVAPTTHIEIREGDLLAPLVGTGDRFHVIVSNPPYLSFAEYEELDPSVSRHEPRDALVSDARTVRGRGRAARAGRSARPRDRRTARRRRSRAGHEPWLERCNSRRPVRPPAVRALYQGGVVLEEKAEDLGRVLGQTDEYKALRRATEALREDQAVQKVLAEAEQLAQEIERAAQQGKEPTKEQVEQYDKALQSVQGNTVYQQMVAAQANFEKLMARINARIYEGIKKGSASPIITLG